MARCWETRGCDEEMQATCPHTIDAAEMCPARCSFASCDRPTHITTSDPALIFAPDIDRSAAIKEQCTFCGFFLTKGPRVG